jgi:hypothetical protein
MAAIGCPVFNRMLYSSIKGKTTRPQPNNLPKHKKERDDQHVEFLLECGTMTAMTSRKLLQTQAGLPTHFSREADRISNFHPVFCWSALKINLLMCKENHNI